MNKKNLSTVLEADTSVLNASIAPVSEHNDQQDKHIGSVRQPCQ